jgi:chromosome segregation ATPase
MAGILTMGHSLKTNAETIQTRSEKGYAEDDIPILESFSLFKDGKPVPDFQLSNEDYNTFLTWLSKGPAKPIPDVGIKVLCFYKQKLRAGLKSFGTTDGFRQKQQNLINTIDEMLKGGDDTQIPGAICAKGGAPPVTQTEQTEKTEQTTPTSECCDAIKDDIETIKTFISGIHVGSNISGSDASGSGKLDDETKAQLTEIKSVVDSIPELINSPGQNPAVDTQPIMDAIQAVATIAQSTEEKTTSILEELAKAQRDIQTILAKPTQTDGLTGLQADYDEAQANAEEARQNAEAATAKLTEILSNPTSTPADIQAAVETATKAKIDVEKNLAVAQYIYKLDSESSAAIPVAQPEVINPQAGGAQIGGKRNKKTPANAEKMQQAKSKLNDLNSAINSGWRKLKVPLETEPTDPTNPNTTIRPSPNASGSNITDFKRQLQVKNAKIAELTGILRSRTESLATLTNSFGKVTGTVASLSAIVTTFVNGSSEMIAELKQKIKLVPGTDDIKADLDAILNRIGKLSKNAQPDQSGQPQNTSHSDKDFDKMKAEYEKEIERLGDLVEEKVTLYERSLREIADLEQEMGKNDETIADLEQQLRTKDERISQLQLEMAALTQELERAREDLDTCLHRTEQPDVEAERLRELVIQHEAKITELTAKLVEKTEDFAKEQQIRLTMEHDLSATKEELEAAQRELISKDQQYADLNQKKAFAQQAFERELREERQENEKAMKKIAALESERDALTAEIASLKSQTNDEKITELQAKLVQALADLEAERAKSAALNLQIQSYDAEKASQLQILEAERAAKNIAQQELAALRVAFDASGDKISLLETQIAEKTAQIESLIEALANDASKQGFAQKIGELNKIIGQKVSTIQKIQDELSAESASKSARELEIANLMKAISIKDDVISKYSQQVNVYYRDMNTALSTIAYYNNLMSHVLEVINNIKRDLKDPRVSPEEIAKRERKISELEQEKAELAAKIEALEYDITSKSKQIEGLTGIQGDLQAKLAQQNLNISGMSSNLLKAQSSANLATEEKARYEEELAKKTVQYEDLLGSSGKHTALIASLKAQLEAALAEAAGNEVAIKSCGVREQQNRVAQQRVDTLISATQTRLQNIVVMLQGIQETHDRNISGRNARIKELEDIISVTKNGKEADELRARLLAEEETSAAEKAALNVAKTEGEQRLLRLKAQFEALQREHDRLTTIQSELEVAGKQKDAEILRISSDLAKKTKEVELNLATIKEKEALIASLQQGQGTELQELQRRYEEQIKEINLMHKDAFEKEEQIKQLTAQLASAKQDKSGVQEQLKQLSEQQAQSEAKYQQELATHRATKAELESQRNACVQTDAEIKRQLAQAKHDLEGMLKTLQTKEEQIQKMLSGTGGEKAASLQQIAAKEHELGQLRASLLVLQTRISSCEGSSQLASTYLSQIENLRRTVDDLTRERDSLKAPYQSSVQQPQVTTRLSQTPKKNGRKNNTLKLGRINKEREALQKERGYPIRSVIETAENREGLAQKSDSQNGNLTFEKNFPALVRLRNSAKAKAVAKNNINPALRAYYNDPAQKYVMGQNSPRKPVTEKAPVDTTGVDPALVSYYANPAQKYISSGGTRKNGKPWSGNQSMNILPQTKIRKGARLARSKRNIYPL